MAGQIKKMIDSIIAQRAKGNPVIENTTIAKLALKGINAKNFTFTSNDSPDMIEKVKQVAGELGVAV